MAGGNTLEYVVYLQSHRICFSVSSGKYYNTCIILQISSCIPALKILEEAKSYDQSNKKNVHSYQNLKCFDHSA